MSHEILLESDSWQQCVCVSG